MLTGALFDIGQYTTRTQVLRLREVWEARCERSCRFMRASLTLSGSQRLARVFDTEVRGGYFTLCGCVVKVRFSCVRGDTIFTATPESDDLWTQVVRAMRGEITGVPPTYRHKPGQTFEYTHSRLRCMAIEMVHTGHALIDGVGLGVWMDGIVEPVFDRRDDLAVEALRLPPRMPPVHAPSLDELLVAKQPTERNHAAVRKPDAATCAGCTAADPCWQRRPPSAHAHARRMSEPPLAAVRHTGAQPEVEDEDDEPSTWGITTVPSEPAGGMCVALSKRCNACAYCMLRRLHSAGASLPCGGPGCQGDACFGARGGLCTECGWQECCAESPCSTCVGFASRHAPGGLCTACGKTKCATVGGCPHGGMAPRGQSLCAPCAAPRETPPDRLAREKENAADGNKRNAQKRKFKAGMGK